MSSYICNLRYTTGLRLKIQVEKLVTSGPGAIKLDELTFDLGHTFQKEHIGNGKSDTEIKSELV